MLLERREEDVLFRHYERRLLDFCNAFKPAMPKSVVVCAHFLSSAVLVLNCVTSSCVTSVRVFAGNGAHVLQKILPKQLRYGIPSKDYYVSSAILRRNEKRGLNARL